MTFNIKVTTPETNGEFVIDAQTVREAFQSIPIRAAQLGFGLLNDGQPVTYEVRITDPRSQT